MLRFVIFAFFLLDIGSSINHACIRKGRVKMRFFISNEKCSLGQQILEPFVKEIFGKKLTYLPYFFMQSPIYYILNRYSEGFLDQLFFD